MKKTFARIISVFSMIFILIMAFPSPVHAQSGTCDGKLMMGQSCTLENGDVQEGPLVVIGGTLSIKNGAQVDGDIFITGGSLDLQGMVKGTVTSIGSVINVGDTAVIEKDLDSVGGTVARSEKSVIKGRVDISSGDKVDFARPTDVIKSLPQSPILFDMTPIKDLFGLMFSVLGMTMLAAFVALFFLKPVERVAETAVKQPAMSVLMGLLTFVVFPALMILLIITLILIPFGLFGFLLMGLAMLFGWIAVAYEVGKRVAAALNMVWAAPVVAGIGAFGLSLASGLLNFIPLINCIGWIFPALISLLGLGAVVISRFGTTSNGYSAAPGHPASPTAPFPQGPVQVVDDDQHENPVV